MTIFDYRLKQVQTLMREGRFDELSTKAMTYKVQASTTEQQLIFEFYAIAAQINGQQHFDLQRIYQLKNVDYLVQNPEFKLRFQNLYGLSQIYQQDYDQALNTYCELLALFNKDYCQFPDLFASSLGNAIYLFNLLGLHQKAIMLYNSIDAASLDIAHERSPSNYFHILENLLISYIELENWTTALVIAESILAMPTLKQFSAFQAMFQMSYGYIIFQQNETQGLVMCLEVAEKIDFTKKGFEYAYKQYHAVLEKSQCLELLDM